MFRRILVPLDGSALAERALATAQAIAAASGARLVLVRVASAAWSPGADVGETQARAIDEAETYLQGIVARLSEQGIAAEIGVPYNDRPAAGILLEIAIRHADLVVMSTHGRSGIGRWIYGSVAEEVLRRSPVPILLVRAAVHDTALVPSSGPPRLLVPLDGSKFAEAALPYAADLAKAFDATIVLFQAIVPPPPPTPELALVGPIIDVEMLEAERLEAERYLGEVAAKLRQDGIRTHIVVRSGLAGEAMAQSSQVLGITLIVMATHGRTGLGRLLFGSVATEMLHREGLPLLLVRPAGLIDGRADSESQALSV